MSNTFPRLAVDGSRSEEAEWAQALQQDDLRIGGIALERLAAHGDDIATYQYCKNIRNKRRSLR